MKFNVKISPDEQKDPVTKPIDEATDEGVGEEALPASSTDAPSPLRFTGGKRRKDVEAPDLANESGTEDIEFFEDYSIDVSSQEGGESIEEEADFFEEFFDDDEEVLRVSTDELEEDVINPLLEEDDDFEGFDASDDIKVKAPGEKEELIDETSSLKKIAIPPKPVLSGLDKANYEAKIALEREAQMAKKPREVALESDELEAKSGLEKTIAYEVSIGEDGREKARSKKLKNKLAKTPPEGKNSSEVAPPKAAGKTVVSDELGREKWSARGDAGRLGDRQLAAFKNLNRGRNREGTDEMVRELMGSLAGDGSTKRERKLAQRAIFGTDQVKSGSRVRFTMKDRDVLRFLAMFKYANAKHLARLHQVKPDTMYRRLVALQERGLVVKKELYGALPIWYLTEGGMICSGIEVPRIREGGITYSMLPHQFVVNHVAGNLWGAGVNVLALEDFPQEYRLLEDGSWGWGESLVSEYEIQSSFASAKAANHKADVYRPAITAAMNRDFGRWKTAGGVKSGPSPEMVRGNEYMWTLFPPFALKLAYHVPDLVVKRPRNDDGSPNSIAVEIELANKPLASYERALSAYKYDSLIYSKVIWVVKSRGAARKLQEAARKLGTWDEGRVGIVPIYTEDGVFHGKAEWTL